MALTNLGPDPANAGCHAQGLIQSPFKSLTSVGVLLRTIVLTILSSSMEVRCRPAIKQMLIRLICRVLYQVDLFINLHKISLSGMLDDVNEPNSGQ